jgi:hypothetical protein
MCSINIKSQKKLGRKSTTEQIVLEKSIDDSGMDDFRGEWANWMDRISLPVSAGQTTAS